MKDEKSDIELFTHLPLSQQTQEGISISEAFTNGRVEEGSFHYFDGYSAKGVTVSVEGKGYPWSSKNRQWQNSRIHNSCTFIIIQYLNLQQILEILLRKQWTPYDGLGALIISPTRELVLPPVPFHADMRPCKYSKSFEK